MIFSGILPVVRADGVDSQTAHLLTFSTAECEADEISTIRIAATSSITLNFSQVDQASFLCVDSPNTVTITLNGDAELVVKKCVLSGCEITSLEIQNGGADPVVVRVLIGGSS